MNKYYYLKFLLSLLDDMVDEDHTALIFDGVTLESLIEKNIKITEEEVKILEGIIYDLKNITNLLEE
jgi:hypothetical protein